MIDQGNKGLSVPEEGYAGFHRVVNGAEFLDFHVFH